MKRILFVAVCSAFILFSWMDHSDAQMCGAMSEGMHGGGMMGGMKHEGMGMMRGMGGGMMGGEHLMWEILTGLNLDEQQKESVRAVKSRVMKDMIRKSADMRISQLEQRDLLDKDPVDMKAVEAKLKQIEALRTNMHLSLISAMEEVKSKLTPEQRKKFREMMEKRPMMGRMGRMHDDGGMMGCDECPMMGGMMHRGSMEEGMPSGMMEGASPSEHRHH